MKSRLSLSIVIIIAMITFSNYAASAQDNRVIRIAKIKIDPAQIDNYKAAVKEQIEAAIKNEAGVLMLYAVYDKNDPVSITVFEIYADTAAYQSHLQTPHFKKYNTSPAGMVKSLELVDVNAIAFAAKPQ